MSLNYYLLIKYSAIQPTEVHTYESTMIQSLRGRHREGSPLVERSKRHLIRPHLAHDQPRKEQRDRN
ncbi:uncharacterized protein LACBIDRAFT_315485 [Laccaria bicolor S238N-H82]|uniref:Predicted protein n=1 Tax=Laccaria bicolor (strain S238N-H82 / ATCC MYA-4686) TaxID=486041 RepID=B0D2I0_LACBS|nr:uncharacterized protein LACBIDRAFT_315485 [Laccaria bicolor S238N-H82]EDR10753.1 predicted protein [Laccaria bicolor S238N-H82]|eukprot:XP_001878054.1 predicted protein [Laccaria bicolor S238N-H82]